jgi:cellulose synthase/poly-beta-1,6-N-acetylglucosamine synthase-like glycosyltransferase/spore germination protein YaaH/peptidoglycan/xylan/chitin deacetylase (PgdA/CDA1 family)
MSAQKQVFQTTSTVRWKSFQWVTRSIVFLLVLIIPIIWIALAKTSKPVLPELVSDDSVAGKLIHQRLPLPMNKKEEKKYKGIVDFLKVKHKNEELIRREKAVPFNQSIRAGFYVNWDPQSFYSLQNYIQKMNVILPEWFHLDPSADTLTPDVEMQAYSLMKKNNVKIIPIINNIDAAEKNGSWDGDMLDRILRNPQKSERLLADIIKYLDKFKLQGINVDFEELKSTSVEPMRRFQRKLYDSLHHRGYMVTQDIMPNNEDFDPKELVNYNDYLFLMAYDQHYSTTVPGPISEQRWIEKVMDETAREIPSDKIVLCMAAFGYDWPKDKEAGTVTYQQAVSTAKINNAVIDFDNNSYNCFYKYTNNGVEHNVYFIDAAGNFDFMRFADEYNSAGVALWRLGSEDERIWRFFNRDLSNTALQKDSFHYNSMRYLELMTDKPDYTGDGEVLDVVSEPAKGEISLQLDSAENMISEEDYLQVPTKYVVRRFGKVNNQVILTFDDGPDPEYTPQILDILKKEKVPAVFFVVGINAQNHLPLLKQIYRDSFEIGNHSFTHPNMATISISRAQTEMQATRLLIEAATGRSTILFRAPYNADAEPTTAVELKPIARSKTEHYYTVGESIDPEDWDTESGVNADSIYNRIVRLYEANPEKGIILLHDAGGDRSATVAALPRIIQYFKNKGVQFATIGQLLHLPKDAIMPPVHNDMLTVNGWVSTFLYWAGQVLFGAFWVAIVLGLIRILLMAGMAAIQFVKSRKNARAVLGTPPFTTFPRVGIIVPAFNEEVNAVKTINNLLQQEYPNLEIYFVDDGSKDNTYAVVSAAFNNHRGVKVFTKPNGGKASALNLGISKTDSDYVVCIDADTQLMPDAISQMMVYFKDDKVGAVAGNVKVGNDHNILTRWQSIEYTTAQNFDRRAFDLVNGITVVPGAIGAFRTKAIIEAGGFTTDTLAEDCDLTIRILRQGYIIRNCTEAIAITEAPETLKQFMKQRFRWSYGVMQSFWKNKDACFNPKFKGLGIIALPNILVFQISMPLISPLADFIFFLSLFLNRNSPESMHKILLFYFIFLLVDVAVSVMAFAFEKEKFHKLLWLIPQRFAYRQLMYVVLFRSIRRAIKGEGQGWGILKRTGNVKAIAQGKQGPVEISTTITGDSPIISTKSPDSI